MLKKVLLAAAFGGAFMFAGLGTASTAEAGGCYRGGGYGGYGGGYYAPGPVYGYGAYAPRSVSYYRSVRRGPVVAYPAYGYPAYGYGYGRRGVSVSFGF